MAITTRLRNTVTDTKPLYAAAGAGDLVLETLRRVPAGLRAELRPKVVRDRLHVLLGTLTALPRQTRATARDRLGRAAGGYDDLAARGTSRLRRLSRQRTTTQDPLDRAGRTVPRTTRKTPRADAAATSGGRDGGRRAGPSASTSRRQPR